MAEIGPAPGATIEQVNGGLLDQYRSTRGAPTATMAEMFASVFGVYALKSAYDAFVARVDASLSSMVDAIAAKASTSALNALPRTRTLYTASASDATVTGAGTRATATSMLPPDARTGNATIAVPAGMLPVGAHLLLMGAGTIGARLTTPPGFNFIPWVQSTGASGKTDLPGFAMAPLLGTDGTCEVWMTISQLASGVRTGGFVRYGASNGQAYSVSLNTGGTGASGALPTIVASDPSVDRTFGVDGFWGAGANAQEYVRCRAVTVTLVLAS